MAVGASIPLKSATDEPDSKYTRLHITPLNPTLLPSILPPAVLSAARNISYHSLQTFPEREFGFVDLPSMEAQKIKKKLNGTILKGEKLKIEDARLPKKKAADGDADAVTQNVGKIRLEEPSKKRKRDTESLHGIELRDRKVKRGWTDPEASKKSNKKRNGKKDSVKSKYTSGSELLFKTVVPANKAASSTNVLGSKPERKKKRKDSKEVTVHEFSKTTKYATFLRSSTISSKVEEVAEYVENKGWVDASGNIVERPIAKSKNIVASDDKDGEESSASSIVEEESDMDEIRGDGNKEPKKTNKDTAIEDSTTSSSGTSSEEEKSNDGISSDSESAKEKTDAVQRSPKTPPSLRIGIPNTSSSVNPEPAPAVHPLEALFKRRRPNFDAPIIPDAVPSFSFFDTEGDNDEDSNIVDSIPMTPFSKQDFALRGLRSAAPTPDTAFPSKSHTLWPTRKSSKELDLDFNGDATPTQNHKVVEADSQKDSTDEPVSDFQKWFYEHRGENNRAWKRRRKLVAKEKRHKENKKRNERND